MSSYRKRVISSCMPCYTRKQKCNREYPCNHCQRRQCIEDCVYYSTSGGSTSSPTLIEPSKDDRSVGEKRKSVTSQSRNEWSARAKPALPATAWPTSCPSLAESYGYFGYSNNNTLALVQRLGLARHDSTLDGSTALSPESADEVQSNIERIPDRQILDFLVQYFVTEINWMGQLVHAPWFRAKYQAWCAVEWVKLVPEVDFAVLLLRICSYSLQFLPSPSYPLDKIRGVSLADIRSSCDETADNLEAISTAADSRGSLIRVQQLAFCGLKHQVEGRIDAFSEVLGRVIRVAQSVGIHSDVARSRKGMDKTDQEMERRTYCNLYIWDSLLSRQLDCVPFLHGRLPTGSWPQLHLLDNGRGCGVAAENIHADRDVDVPDPFAERLLQAHLADFWRSVAPAQDAEYEVIAAEERYDKFCREYLSQLPPVFALVDPDETWDKWFPKLALQRQQLHIAIYDSLCWNFRPLLLRRPNPLPSYKAVVLNSQIKSLSVAALQSLVGVTQLHALLGGFHTPVAAILSSTFESAVVLLYLLTDPSFPKPCAGQPPPTSAEPKTDPLHVCASKISRLACLQAAQGALKRLRMLAEGSSMADLGATILGQLLSKIPEAGRGRGSAGVGTGTEDMGAAQNHDVGSSTTTAITTAGSQLESRSATTGAGGKLSLDGIDLRSVNGFVAIGDTMDVGDMAPWPYFDTANMYAQDVEYFGDS